MAKGREKTQDRIMAGAKNGFGTVMISLILALLIGPMLVYAGGILFQLFYGYTPITTNVFDTFEYGRTAGRNQTIGVSAVLIVSVLAYCIKRQRKGKEDDDRNIKISKRATYGTARFLSKKEAREKLEVGPIKRVNGFILGKIGKEVVALPQDTMFNKHILVIGAPGSRKSRSFVRPMIMQSVKNGQSCLVTDPKGEIYRDTAVYLRKEGYDVRVFNLVDPKHSDSWACMDEIGGDPDMAAVFADVIVSNIIGTENKKADFWSDSAKNLLKAIILYVEQNQDMRSHGKATIGEAYKLIATTSVPELEAIFSGIGADHPAHMPFQIFAGASAQVKDSIKHELGVYLEVFQNESIRDITSYPEINLEKPAYDKCAYFVIISDQHSALNFLSSLFFSFLFIKIVNYADNKTEDGRCPVQVNMILDEFPSIGLIPGYLKKLATVRGRGISCSHIIQNLSQLIEMYGKNYESILSNCDTHIFLGGNDPTTIKYISDRSGVIGVDQQSTGSQRRTFAPVEIIPRYVLNKSEGKRNLLNPDEIYTLDPSTSIVFIRSLHALRVEKFDYTEHPASERLIQENALSHIPEWTKLKKRSMQPAAERTIVQASSEVGGEGKQSPFKLLVESKSGFRAEDNSEKTEPKSQKSKEKAYRAVKKEEAIVALEEVTDEEILRRAARPNKIVNKNTLQSDMAEKPEEKAEKTAATAIGKGTDNDRENQGAQQWFKAKRASEQ